MRLPALLGLLPLLAIGCRSTATAPSAALPAHAGAVIAADPDATTELACGQLLRVVLEGNPSTGYVWAVDGALPPQLEAIDGLPAGQDEAASSNTPMAGAPKTQWLHFRAVQPGQAELRLRWHRPWEAADAAAARSARYRINVR